MTPQRYCETITRRSGSSFGYAMGLLPDEKRRAMYALYAFCRAVDDIADRVREAEVARAKLGFWREEIARVFEGRPWHPIGRELAWARARFGWRPEPFAMVLDGMQWDIDRRPIRTEADLKRYCACVAGAVGVLANAVFGLEGHDALAFALGEALQRTNILRDLAEDAARGRIYIPEERRRGYQVPDEAFRTGALTPKMRALLADEAARAKRAFADARALLACADPEAARPVVAMGAIYRAQLARLERIGFDVWRRRAPLLPIAKVWIAWRAWRGQRAF